jgi:hypothetical protein
MHINERGTHTTVIEAAKPILDFLSRAKGMESATLSPGKIEGGVGAKSKSVKFKHINDELYEMVITHNGARQEFKLFTRTTPDVLASCLKADKKLTAWNVNYTDMRNTHQ